MAVPVGVSLLSTLFLYFLLCSFYSKSGVLSIAEFCQYFGIQRNKLADRVFGALDIDESGELSFKGANTSAVLAMRTVPLGGRRVHERTCHAQSSWRECGTSAP